MSRKTKTKTTQQNLVPPGSDIHWDMWSALANSAEPHETDYWLLQLLPEDTKFIDIGANIGNSALSSSKVNSKLSITSFEANFSLEKYLNKTKEFLEKKGCDFRFYLFGLGDEKKTIDLYVPKIDNWYVIGESSMVRDHFDQETVSKRLASYSPHGKWSLEKGQVQIEKFDGIYENIFTGAPKRFFVKIDVEGFEENVIDGMREFIGKYHPGFLIEVNEQKGPCKKLLELGYAPYHYDHAKRLIRHGFNPNSLNAIYLNQSAIEALQLSDKVTSPGHESLAGQQAENHEDKGPHPASEQTLKLSLAEEFFDQTAEYAIEQFLKNRGGQATLFCEESFYSWFEQRVPNRLFSLRRIEDLAGYNEPQRINLFVLDPYNETELFQRYGRGSDGRHIRYLLRDVAMALSLKKDPFDFELDAIARLPLPKHTLSITCLPRSGSTWLVAILGNLGVGKPVEHIRPAVVYLSVKFAPYGFSFDVWFQLVVRLFQQNGVFSTKFITTFLMMLSSRPPKEKLADISWHLGPEALSQYHSEAESIRLAEILKKHLGPNHQAICLNRADKAAQAVSHYVAAFSGVWAVRNKDEKESHDKAMSLISYDYSALESIDRRFAAEEEFRDRFLLKLADDPDAVINIDYEALANDTQVMIRTLKQIAAKVQHSVDEKLIMAAKESTGMEKQGTVLNRCFAERYGFQKSLAHFNPKTTPNFGYALQDFNVVDYGLERLEGTELLVRGPIPDFTKEFIVFLGAAQTFGRFCTKPFPNLVGEFLELPVLNLGFSGAGPDFFLENEVLIEIANKAKFIVVQVMSARSVSAHPFSVDPYNNGVLINTLTGEKKLADLHFNNILLRESKETALALRENFKSEYSLKMKSLMQKLKRPKALLLISNNKRPDEEARDFGANVHSYTKGFPHFVTNQMVEDLATHADYYIEAIGMRGFPQVLISRYTNEPEQVFPATDTHVAKKDMNNYYTSPETHCDIAMSVIKNFSKVNWDVSKRKTKIVN